MDFIEDLDSRYDEPEQTSRNDETSQPNNSAQVRDPGRIPKQHQIPRKYCTTLAHPSLSKLLSSNGTSCFKYLGETVRVTTNLGRGSHVHRARISESNRT